ncbi:MAG: hypothetical protein MUC97_04395 [Bernardetiaceae bacterium]|jgi:hypothetical protein|nr:hypothetical protein [Bernardetiaceae bacterium]
MKLLKVGSIIFLFCLLTVLTQVGGLVYLFSRLTYRLTDPLTNKFLLKFVYRFVSTFITYCLVTFAIVPIIAKPFGRVPLPLMEKNHLQPLNVWTCLLNRHYVRPALKQAMFEVAQRMNTKFPGTTINYLDANFPFINQFPLIPHRSHNDGKKLDLAFCYHDRQANQPTNECPSLIGYGICEEPRPSEKNAPNFCAQKGYWQYGFLPKIIPQTNKKKFTFDHHRTKELIIFLATHPAIGKIFIEPHLKTRLNLTSDKVRFHGCQAVRHDDHLHLQLK